jgi:hypothetical protein
MHRAAIFLVGLALVSAQPLASQEQRPAEYAYEAYYSVDYADLDDWNRQYWTYSVPVLEKLQEEGVIQGWSQWQHMTGGADYNIRFVARTFDWASLQTFWGEYLSRLQAAMPESEWEAGNRMIVEHVDAIWDIGGAHVPEGADTRYMYASTFRLSFADMEQWDALWSDVVTPILEQAMSDGLLTGWVKLEHNTGGPHNSKVLYFFDDWDPIDDLFTRMLDTMAEEHPAEWARANEIMQAHDDVIWAETRRAGM